MESEKDCKIEDVLNKPTLVEDLGMMFPTESSNQRYRFGIYECPFCGNHFKAQTRHVKNEGIKSCGCYQKSQSSKSNIILKTTHGEAGTRLYKIWASIKARTLNTKDRVYKDYGGRGISICDEWENDFVTFKDWALSNGYSHELSIDRIDNDKGYYPNNCRWTTKTIQCRNQRIRKDNTSGFRGVTFNKKIGEFRARITIDKKSRHLGYFLTALEAGVAYNNYITKNNLEGFILNETLNSIL